MEPGQGLLWECVKLDLKQAVGHCAQRRQILLAAGHIHCDHDLIGDLSKPGQGTSGAARSGCQAAD